MSSEHIEQELLCCLREHTDSKRKVVLKVHLHEIFDLSFFFINRPHLGPCFIV
jgi:hypothetical protein